MQRNGFAAAALVLTMGCSAEVSQPRPQPPAQAKRVEVSTAKPSAKPPLPRPLPAGCEPATEFSAEESGSGNPYPVWREPAPSAFEQPTEYAELLEPLVGEYTPLALEAGISGIVILEVVVSAEGEALGARVLKGLPCGLEAQAKKAVKNGKFRPARRGERAIDSLLRVAVTFQRPLRH